MIVGVSVGLGVLVGFGVGVIVGDAVGLGVFVGFGVGVSVGVGWALPGFPSSHGFPFPLLPPSPLFPSHGFPGVSVGSGVGVAVGSTVGVSVG